MISSNVASHAVTPTLRLVDSITELTVSDRGCIAVSGSHGGVSSARYAIAARPLLSVFNDAGVGRNQAGIAALEMMQAQGLAACAVAHDSACIGSSQSTFVDGVVSYANALAGALGITPGVQIRRIEILERLNWK